MTAAYLGRLACLSLACFFLVHTALAAMVLALAPRAIRLAGRLRPAEGARLLLALRLMPVTLASAAVAGLCVPSFLWLEPSQITEETGRACLVAALLGAALGMTALGRASKALLQSRRYLRLWKGVARQCPPSPLADGADVWMVDANSPLLALAGVVQPRVLISRGLMEALDAEQLAVALRHEDAHRQSRDNLKRLALLWAPEILPGCRAFGALERAWARVTEWAADERAAEGDARRRLALAEALVRVVRLGSAAQRTGALATTLLEDPRDLEARVARLLEPPALALRGGRYWTAAAGLAAGALAVLLLQPATLYSVHWLLEGLMR